LAIRQEIGDRDGEGSTLNNIGNIYYRQQQYGEALETYQQALAIRQEIGDRDGEGSTLNDIGNIYSSQGQYEEALETYQQALAISQEIGDRDGEGSTLNNIGNIYYRQRQYGESLETYQQALAISQEIGDRDGEGDTQFNLAYLYRAQDNLPAAKAAIDEALSIVEQIRADISGNDARITYLATVQDYYQLKVDILMQLHQQQPQNRYDIEALATADQGRARGLLDLLTEANADIFKDIDPALRQRYQALQFQIEALEKESIRLASSEATQAQVPTVQADLKALRDDESNLREEIRQQSPTYAALNFPKPLTVAEMQAQLDANTLMLYYALGETQSYLWAVTPDSVTSYVLPYSRAAIDTAARDVRDVLANPGMYGVPATTPDAQGRTIAGTTRTLSDLILAPVADQLGQKRLVIVADGELQYVPFAALNLPGQAEDAYTPLVANHDLVNLPSASTIAILRETVINDRQPAPKTLAVLYDPVFGLNDDRLNPSASATTPALAATTPDPADPLNQAALERVTRSFKDDRLIYTRAEAEAILGLVPEGEEVATHGFDANYPWLDQPNLSQYRYIHLATHGFFDETNPELSGLVLSLYDQSGHPQRGYLRLGDLFNLNLPADMIVLSACQTALGENVRGEGIVGVTRGLMYAGAPRVVTSLWNVDDEATADLMQQFYQQILVDQVPPSAALSATQRAMWQQGQSPYLWAAFTLQGEWR
jgi:CHAT domain-containing protein